LELGPDTPRPPKLTFLGGGGGLLGRNWTIPTPLFSIHPVLKLTFQTAGKNQSVKTVLLCLWLFGTVFWVFLPSLQGHFIDYDDSPYVTENAHIQFTPGNLAWALTHEVAANWHPLTLWSLMLDHRFYGFNPWGYHLTNVLLHAVNSVLLFLVLCRMTGATWRSLAVAGLFGLHPLRVESVAWISERKDVLSVLFWLLTLCTYVRYAQKWSKAGLSSPRSAAPEGRETMADPAVRAFGSRFWTFVYFLALLFFTLGLMSKPMVVTLPCVLLLLDFWPLERWRKERWWGLVMEKSPFFLLSAIVSVITYVVQRNTGMMKSLVGVSLPFGLRLENALVSYGRYWVKLLWPADLCALYLHPGHWPLRLLLLAGLLVAGLSVLAFALRREQPYLLTGWFWYLGTFLPVIGLIQVGTQSMADRYSYIPSVGMLIILVWEFHWLTGKWRHRNFIRGTTGGAMVLACIFLTRHQLIFWRDEISLWRRAIAVTEDNYDAHNRLGSAFFAQGSAAAGIREFQEAIRLNPALAEPWCILGYYYNSQGNVDAALACYQKALETQPGLVAAYLSLGNILLNAGRVDEAMLQLQKAARLNPRLAAAEDSLGRAFVIKGCWNEAIACYQKELEIQPDSAATWTSLGLVYSRTGRFNEALAAFQKAVAIQPEDDTVRNNLGYVLLQMQQLDGAIQQFQTALKLQPNNAESHNNLGSALLAKGQLGESISEFQEALRLKPGYVDASHNLTFALQQKGKTAPLPTDSKKP
jgi:protein O-mannosyl-transferase